MTTMAAASEQRNLDQAYTLVLNAGWQPERVVSWQDVMSLLVSGRVEVVHEYEDLEVRTVSVNFAMPSVVRLVKGLRYNKGKIRFSRHNVWARDGGRCQYCGVHVPRHAATYDHVVPRSRGGATDWKNIVISCFPCNQRKGARLPEEAGMKLRSLPSKPTYLPDVHKVQFSFDKGTPVEWRHYLTNIRYWNDDLDTSGGHNP